MAVGVSNPLGEAGWGIRAAETSDTTVSKRTRFDTASKGLLEYYRIKTHVDGKGYPNRTTLEVGRVGSPKAPTWVQVTGHL